SSAEKAKVFDTLERLPVETVGSIRFLVGNLQDLTAFLAFSLARGGASRATATCRMATRTSRGIGSAPTSNARRGLARDHAAPEATLSLSKATQPCFGRVRP